MEAKYHKIIEYIEQQLDKGSLVAGSKLPSIRSLSEQFSCSKSTVTKAYNELEKAHLIYSVPKSGYYVVHELHHMENDQQEIDFLSGGPDKNVMPYKDFQHCMNQAIEQYKEELFTYSDQQGLKSLRDEIVKHLQSLQVFTTPERLVIVSGSQQAIHLLISTPFPNGKKNILIEQPTYFGIVESVQIHHVTTLGIEVTMNGIDLERLEYIFRNNDIKFFYVIPRFHNPLGHSYTNDEKKKMVELAEKYDVYIVEDDFLGDLDTDLKADPFFSYNPFGRVIYIKSFSKVFLPGLRIASVVLPPLMVKPFLRQKFSSDFNSCTLSQGALEIYLKSGIFQSHLKKIQQLYETKMQILQQACAEFFPENVQFSKPKSGFVLAVFLPENVSAKQLVAMLQERHVYIDNASRMFLPEYAGDHLIRLSVSQVAKNQIRQGVKKVSECIQILEERKTNYIKGLYHM